MHAGTTLTAGVVLDEPALLMLEPPDPEPPLLIALDDIEPELPEPLPALPCEVPPLPAVLLEEPAEPVVIEDVPADPDVVVLVPPAAV